MKYVLVFGATGFVGEAIVDELILQNYIPILVVRNPEKISPEQVGKVIIQKGDISKLSTFKQIFQNYFLEACIYSVGIIKGKKEDFENAHFIWPKNILEEAQKFNLNKFIYISANGVENNSTAYQSTKLKFEEYLKNNSKISYNIVRPSIITGNSDKYNFIQVVNSTLLRFPLVPLINGAKSLVAPISRSQVAAKIVHTISNESESLIILKGEILSYKNFLESLAKIYNKKFIPIFIPVFFIRLIIFAFGWIPKFPISKDQLKMLLQDNS